MSKSFSEYHGGDEQPRDWHESGVFGRSGEIPSHFVVDGPNGASLGDTIRQGIADCSRGGKARERFRYFDRAELEDGNDKVTRHNSPRKIPEGVIDSLRRAQDVGRVGLGVASLLKSEVSQVGSKHPGEEREEFIRPLPDALLQVGQSELAKHLGSSLLEQGIKLFCEGSIGFPILRIIIAVGQRLF